MTEGGIWTRTRGVALRWRELITSPWRCLSDFLIIGAQKAGTTSLFAYLGRNPAVWTPKRKECNHFTSAVRLQGWYRTHFPSWSQRVQLERSCGAAVRIGEATPYYLFHPAVPARVARLIPDARLIALLREPVARAHSHYRHNVRLGLESLSFEDALAAEPERLADTQERLASGWVATSHAHRHYSYVARGRYAEQLERWYGRFDRSRVLVVLAEEFFAEPARVVQEVEDFLGVPHVEHEDFAPMNVGDSALGLEEGTRQRLQAEFTEPNRRLAELLGRELSCW